MGEKEPTDISEGSNADLALSLNSNATSQCVRSLTVDELAELRRNMAESSAWMRTELARRRSQAR